MVRCKATTKKGNQCKRAAISSGEYCSIHLNAGDAAKKGTDNLAVQVAELGSQVRKLSEKASEPKKDFWDKISSSSTLISGSAIALVGIFATSVYNERQLDAQNLQKERELQVRRVQTVEKFFPYLIEKNESTKQGALLTIAALGDEELATNLAKHFGGKGSVSALKSLARSDDQKVAKAASEALTKEAIIDLLYKATGKVVVEGVSSDGLLFRRVGTGFFVSTNGRFLTAAHLLNIPGTSNSTAGSWPGADTRIEISLLEESRGRKAKLLKVNRQLDLALFQVDIDENTPAISFAEKEPKFASEVMILGHTRPFLTLLISGRIVASRPTELLIDASLHEGFSGAPVVNSVGQIVGVVIGASSNYVNPHFPDDSPI